MSVYVVVHFCVICAMLLQVLLKIMPLFYDVTFKRCFSIFGHSKFFQCSFEITSFLFQFCDFDGFYHDSAVYWLVVLLIFVYTG